jgi:hypothetical protein
LLNRILVNSSKLVEKGYERKIVFWLR